MKRVPCWMVRCIYYFCEISISFFILQSSQSFSYTNNNADPNHDREKLEKEEMDRMKERMTLAHKNTSKWARRVLRRGAKMDPDERRALSLQIAKGDELRKKMMGEESGEDGTDDEDESEDMLLKKARDILMEKSDVTEESLGKRKGLFELDFMKKGMEAQRARAKEEARRLLEELEANEAAMPTDSEDSEDETPVKIKPTKPKVASEEETNKVLPDGRLVATSLEFGKSDAFGVVFTDNAGADGEEDEEDAVDNNNENNMKKKKKKSKKKRKSQDQDANNGVDQNNVQVEEEENPWLAATKNESAIDSKPQTSARKKSKLSSNMKVDIDAAASMLVDAPNKNDQQKETVVGEETEETPKNSDTGLASLSQAELVKRAFASPDDLEAEKEFQEEKVRFIEPH